MEAYYQDITDRGDTSALAELMRGMISARGGEILDENALQQLARTHCRPGSPDINYGSLEQALQHAHWIRYPEGFCAGEPSSSRGSEIPEPPEKKGKSAGEDFIFLPEHRPNELEGGAAPLLPPQPSAPPPPEAGEAASSSTGCAIPGGFSEVLVNSTNVTEEHGPLLILWSRVWNPLQWWAAGRINYTLVLQSPGSGSRGIRLFEGLTLEEARTLARSVPALLQAESQEIATQQCYHSVLHDPELMERLKRLLSYVQVSSATSSSAAAAASSSSSSSSSTAPPPQPQPQQQQHQHSHLHGDESTQDAEQPEGPGECPICLNEIHPSDAAMRCNGQGGHHHYFHSNCMKEWIRQCRAGRAPNCPVCRGTIQFNAQRLEDFLHDRRSENLSSEDRSFLEECAARLRAAGESWGEAMNWENAKHVGGIAAAGGWGFMIGYMQPPPDLQYHMTLSLMTREQNVAQSVGWVLGLIARMVREYYKKRQEDEERERRRNDRRS